MKNSFKNSELFCYFFSCSLSPLGNSSEDDTRLSIGSKNFTHGELQEFKLAIDN